MPAVLLALCRVVDIFRFAEDYAETLVFRRKAMLEATEPLMSENGIPRRGSDDVLAVWNGKVAKN